MPEVLDKATLRALGAESRQEIIKLLGNRPHTASEIAKRLGKHVTTITEHLDVLEQSDLISRKDGTNKWVYYTLTPKGEKLFKPAYYSWVVIFSVSLLCLIIGLSKFATGTYSVPLPQAEKAMSTARDATGSAAPSEAPKAPESAPPVPEFLIGGALIAAGLGGFGYLLLRKKQVSWER